MLRHIFVLFLVIGNIAVAAPAADNASEMKLKEVRQYVDTVGNQVLAVVNGAGSDEQKQTQLRQLFVDNVDIDWMGHFVLGRYWQQASEAERAQYIDAYKKYLLKHYTVNFADYTGSKYTVTGVKGESKGRYLVMMKIKSPQAQKQETQAGYRLYTGANGQLKIIDIIIEGVSLLSTQRSEFSSVVQQKGLGGLIQELENKTKEAGRASSP